MKSVFVFIAAVLMASCAKLEFDELADYPIANVADSVRNVIANAEGLQQTLKQQGYNAQVVVNNNVEPAMYRVVATTFATKAEAAASRTSLKGQYPGAWLLYAK